MDVSQAEVPAAVMAGEFRVVEAEEVSTRPLIPESKRRPIPPEVE